MSKSENPVILQLFILLHPLFPCRITTALIGTVPFLELDVEGIEVPNLSCAIANDRRYGILEAGLHTEEMIIASNSHAVGIFNCDCAPPPPPPPHFPSK